MTGFYWKYRWQRKQDKFRQSPYNLVAKVKGASSLGTICGQEFTLENERNWLLFWKRWESPSIFMKLQVNPENWWLRKGLHQFDWKKFNLKYGKN